MVYKGRHYNRALLKEATRKLTEVYARGRTPAALERAPENHSSLDRTADYNLLTVYLGFLAAAKTDWERSGWWREVQAHARRLGYDVVFV